MKHSKILLGVLLSLTLATLLSAQAVSGAEISGQVTDPSGSAVPSANLKATETAKGIVHTTTSDSGGLYVFTNLPVGAYRFEVTAPGFKSYVQTGIVLQVGQNVTQNVAMQIGAVSENVQVMAGANMVETKDNAISQVIDQKRIVELPLNGRQVTDLITLTGAAQAAPAGDMTGTKSFYSSTTISVGGGQANGTNYLLDGGDHNDTFGNTNLPFPFPEALQEFSVETSAIPARNGSHPGGQVNAVTRSGTNGFHGDAFEYFRNGNLNARNAFASAQDTLKRNQFGATIGGPIKKDKAFFFFGIEYTRARQYSSTNVAHVPTAAALKGDFTTLENASSAGGCLGTARTLKDPITGTALAQKNIIPTSEFDPAALKLIPYLPTTTDPCGLFLYTAALYPGTNGASGWYNDAQYIGKVDYRFNDRHSIFGRYFVNNFFFPALFDPKDLLVTATPGNNERAQSLVFGDTYTLSPTMVNSFHATFDRRRDNRAPSDQQINLTNLGVTNIAQGVPNDIRLSISNYFNVGCGTCSPGHFNVNTFQVADDIDWIKGRHHIAMGVNIMRTQNNTLSGYLQNASVAWNGQFSGDALADFLTGAMQSYNQSRPQQVAMRETIPGLYIQDTFKLNNRMTINAGIRWEPTLFPVDTQGRGSVFNQADFYANKHSTVFPNAPAGMYFLGDAGVNPSFTSNTLTNFAPRVGLVWDPTGSGKQTIRVGGALLYDTGMVWFSQRLMSNPPVVNEIDNTFANTFPAKSLFSNPWSQYPGGNPFPGSFPAPKNVTFPGGGASFWAVLPDQIKPMYTGSWNASYQRQLAGDWLVSVSYLGNKTTHVWLTRDLNPCPPATSSCAGAKRLFSTSAPAANGGLLMGQVALADDGGNASYHAMLASVTHRFGHGFTLLANYTWSHCIADGEFNGDLRGSYYQNPLDRRADRGDCNYDLRNIVNVSMVASSPTRGGQLQRLLLGGWQVAPIIRAYSGSALNITSGSDRSGTGENLDRVNLVAGGSPYLHDSANPLQFLNNVSGSAFVLNPTGTFGTLGRDVIRGPGSVTVDFALSRAFTVRESMKLDFRWELFNAMNTVNFSNPASNFSSGTFGKFTAAKDPRIMQLAMKFHY